MINKKRSKPLKRKILLIISTIFIFGQIAAQEISKSDYNNASVSIKYYNRSIYYPENNSENPINVHITIKNNGSETLRFKLADDRTFSLDFKVFTVKNSQLPQTEEVIEKRMGIILDKISHWDEFDYVIVNANLQETVTKIQKIIS